MAQRRGRGRPPKPAQLRRTRRLPLLLTTAEHAALNRYCTRHNVSANEVVRGCLKRFLEVKGVESAGAGRQGKGGRR
jgi:hypothetical protein